MATETNNLKLSKADSNDAIIQTLYANNNNLDIIDENICIECGTCNSVCPVDAPQPE